MGFPHATPDVPGFWPLIHAEVERIVVPDELSQQLSASLSGEHTDFPGHVCATAWVLSPDAQQMLLVRHRRLGWSNPGGHVHPHETTFQAALRELEEETGLTKFDVFPAGDAPILVHVTDTDSGGVQHRHWNVAWLFTADPKLALSEQDDATWWPTSNLPTGPDDLEKNASTFVTQLMKDRFEE